MKYPVKIIALDLDDTLLKADLSISDYTVETLQRACQQGIYVVLSSGRTENAILPHVRRLEIAGFETGRYMIALNGSSIYDMHLRRQIYSRTVEPDILIAAAREAKKRHLYSEVYDATTIYVPEDNEWTQLDVRLSGLKMQIVPDYEAFLQKGHPKMLIPGEPEVLQELQPVLKEMFGSRAVIFTSKPYFLEIMPANAGKGEALQWLAETHLGLQQNQTMAFGDSFNDESMLRYACHSVCMKNGNPEMKAVAAHVSDFTNEEDGVARFIQDYVL